MCQLFGMLEHFGVPLNFGSLNFEFYKNRGVLKHANVASDGGAPDQYHPDILRAHEDRNIASNFRLAGDFQLKNAYPDGSYNVAQFQGLKSEAALVSVEFTFFNCKRTISSLWFLDHGLRGRIRALTPSRTLVGFGALVTRFLRTERVLRHFGHLDRPFCSHIRQNELCGLFARPLVAALVDLDIDPVVARQVALPVQLVAASCHGQFNVHIRCRS
mmetsp:Transcript_11536/g.27148  ORF Transcript_11536/g.27148 Transcript_11536/m.27148 type:complete len:216 (+) Transcript_11536:610-1257(+)